MGRTINGKLTGAAARTQWQDMQDQIQIGIEKAAAKRQAQLMDMTQEIRDTMTQEEYNAWWEAAPEQGFYSYTEDYLLALKLCNRIVADAQGEMETTLVMMSGILRGDGTLPLDDEYELTFSGGEIIDRSLISQEIIF